jgi:hypothetical protein
MRGIVELEIMRAIEGAMGVRLPIQCFFDLIVGTRYVDPSSKPHFSMTDFIVSALEGLLPLAWAQ